MKIEIEGDDNRGWVVVYYTYKVTPTLSFLCGQRMKAEGREQRTEGARFSIYD